jgi:hypothetical protein
MSGFYGIVIIYFKENTFFVFTSNNLSQKTAVALNSRSRFISGFVATEPVAIPNAHILNENRIITKITGKLAGMHVNGF